jgi:hypothetical protein
MLDVDLGGSPAYHEASGDLRVGLPSSMNPNSSSSQEVSAPACRSVPNHSSSAFARPSNPARGAAGRTVRAPPAVDASTSKDDLAGRSTTELA